MTNTVDCGIATEVLPNFFAREHIYEYNFQCPEGTTGDYNLTRLISLISWEKFDSITRDQLNAQTISWKLQINTLFLI